MEVLHHPSSLSEPSATSTPAQQLRPHSRRTPRRIPQPPWVPVTGSEELASAVVVSAENGVREGGSAGETHTTPAQPTPAVEVVFGGTLDDLARNIREAHQKRAAERKSRWTQQFQDSGERHTTAGGEGMDGSAPTVTTRPSRLNRQVGFLLNVTVWRSFFHCSHRPPPRYSG